MIGQYNTNNSAAQAPIVTDAESAVADKPKLPLSRAAIIAKAQAAKNGRVFIAPSAAAKRSARLKTSNYKPILAAGKGSLAHLEQSRKEAAEKKAKEEEEARALKKEKEKEGKMRRFLDHQVKQLMQRLSDEAVMDLPDNFYKLTADTKLKILVDAHLEYRKRGLNRVRGDMTERTEESGRILGVSFDNALREGIALIINRRSSSWRSCRTSRVPWSIQRSIRSVSAMSARSPRVVWFEKIQTAADRR
jgi:hypothetical protein